MDFASGALSMLGKDVDMEPVITASRGQIEVPSVRPLDRVRGYRVTFDLKPTDDSLVRVSITIFSTCKVASVSGRWSSRVSIPPSC